jgi:hypothetical protein
MALPFETKLALTDTAIYITQPELAISFFQALFAGAEV